VPTYEYECDACQHRFDELQSFSDPPLKTCPECKKNKLRRLFGTGAAVLFKGSGFYETDYRSEAYKSAAKADSDAAKGGSPGSSGKGDGAAKAGGGGDAKSSKPAT
jgi:putative FmdB family regulatory protein